jgi:hypothetical protein
MCYFVIISLVNVLISCPISYFFCHEVPRVAIFDDLTYDVIMTSFVDLPGKLENSYIVSHSSNHNSRLHKQDKNTALSWKLMSK